MKIPLASCFLPLALLLMLPGARGADVAPDVVGLWTGSITLPTAALDIRVELAFSPGRGWQGTIDIPAQGLRGYRLDPVKIEGMDVSLTLPGIPGGPGLAGQLAADGKSIAGDFHQAGQRFPFKLGRAEKPAPLADAEPKGIPGKGLAGYWLGALKPVPGVELRLALDVKAATADGGEGVLVSLDQNNARIPLTAVAEKDGIVRVEAGGIGGTFVGRMNADGSELNGAWEQRGQPVQLLFRRVNRPAVP